MVNTPQKTYERSPLCIHNDKSYVVYTKERESIERRHAVHQMYAESNMTFLYLS